MSVEEGKSMVRRWLVDVINKRDPAALDEIAAPDFAGHFSGLRDPIHGVDAWKRMWGSYCAAFPDFHLVIEDQVAEEDLIAIRYTWRATQRGQFKGTQPTGQTVSGRGMCFFRIANGKIAEEWNQDEEMS